MPRWIIRTIGLTCCLVAVAGCGGTATVSPAEGFSTGSTPSSFAIYAEYAQSNTLMAPGLNRRAFNTVEAQSGSDIALNDDGSIALQPGTYRISGLSITTMQTGFAPPEALNGSDYPGYALVYAVDDESSGIDLLDRAIAVGTPQTALDTTPSIFETVYATDQAIDIAVGHQSGEDLNDEVYLSIYEVDGIPSDYHVFARISITEL